MSKCDKPYVYNQEDTYLTLDVLATILEQLSEEAGKVFIIDRRSCFHVTFGILKRVKLLIELLHVLLFYNEQ